MLGRGKKLRWINKWSNYYLNLKRYYAASMYGPRIVNKSKDASKEMLHNKFSEEFWKHPGILEINELTGEIKYGNISHQYSEGSKYIGKRVNEQETYLFGPFVTVFETKEQWADLYDTMKKVKPFDFEAELKKDTYNELMKKMSIIEFNREKELLKLQNKAENFTINNID